MSHSYQTGKEGIKQGISSSYNISGNYIETVLPQTNGPASQTEKFSCPTMEKVSPGIATELTAQDLSCFCWQDLYLPASPRHGLS